MKIEFGKLYKLLEIPGARKPPPGNSEPSPDDFIGDIVEAIEMPSVLEGDASMMSRRHGMQVVAYKSAKHGFNVWFAEYMRPLPDAGEIIEKMRQLSETID